MLILGIETSCDDTGVALYDTELGLIANHLASQIELHAPHGGVVPELAARDHIKVLMPVVSEILKETRSNGRKIDGVAYTLGPGLAGALLVGASFSRSLAWAWKVPSVGVHHMEGHLLAPMLENKTPKFPFIALLVSGGHTLLVDVIEVGDYKILGSTLDDAAGEAFDKTAKLLGLTYPGGPAIARAAKNGNPKRWNFPRPMTDRPGLDFSFSGLKTFTRNTAMSIELDDQNIADIASSFQEAAVDTLVIKCKRALLRTGRDRLIVAGGVGANQLLRERLNSMVSNLEKKVFYPRLEFCTDNGAMIAYAGSLRLRHGLRQTLDFSVRPRWPLSDLSPLSD